MNAPQSSKHIPARETGSRTIPWGARLALLLFMGVAAVTVWVTNQQLTHRFTNSTRNRGELRLALYSGNLVSELRRHAIVPQLLARDQTLISALQSQDFSLSTQRLLSFIDEIGANSIMLMANDGRTVAATDRGRLGEAHRTQPYFVDALRSNDTIFTTVPRESGGYRFVYARRITMQAETLGVILVEVDLAKFEPSFFEAEDATFEGFIKIGQYRFEMWTYDGFYRDPVTGDHVEYVAPENVLMFCKNSRLDLSYGSIPRIVRPDPRVRPFLPPRISSSKGLLDLTPNAWVSPDGTHVSVSVGTRPLTIPTAIDTFANMRVVP